MRIDRWLTYRSTKIFCIALAAVFAAQQVASGDTLHALQMTTEQQRQLDLTLRGAVVTIYDDLYGRSPTDQEVKEAIQFLHRSPQLAHLVERLSESPEYRWKLRQMSPERIKRRQAEAQRIADAVAGMVGQFLRDLQPQEAPGPIVITDGLTVEPPTPLTGIKEEEIASLQSWLRAPETLCGNCAPNALAPLLGMVGVPVTRDTLTAEGFLVEYLSGNLDRHGNFGAGDIDTTASEPAAPTSPAPVSVATAASAARRGPLTISMDTVQRVSRAHGLVLNPVELTTDEFFAIRHPMIVALDLTQDGLADHYVVVQSADEGRVVYFESDGTREVLPTHAFLKLFTRFALVAGADAQGRLLAADQARAIRGAGRKDDYFTNWGYYPDLGRLFEGPKFSWKDAAFTAYAAYTGGAQLNSFAKSAYIAQISRVAGGTAYLAGLDPKLTSYISSGLNYGLQAQLSTRSGAPGGLDGLGAGQRFSVGFASGVAANFVTAQLRDRLGVNSSIASWAGANAGYLTMAGLSQQMSGGLPRDPALRQEALARGFKPDFSFNAGVNDALRRNWQTMASQGIGAGLTDLTRKSLGSEWSSTVGELGSSYAAKALDEHKNKTWVSGSREQANRRIEIQNAATLPADRASPAFKVASEAFHQIGADPDTMKIDQVPLKSGGVAFRAQDPNDTAKQWAIVQQSDGNWKPYELSKEQAKQDKAFLTLSRAGYGARQWEHELPQTLASGAVNWGVSRFGQDTALAGLAASSLAKGLAHRYLTPEGKPSATVDMTSRAYETASAIATGFGTSSIRPDDPLLQYLTRTVKNNLRPIPVSTQAEDVALGEYAAGRIGFDDIEPMTKGLTRDWTRRGISPFGVMKDSFKDTMMETYTGNETAFQAASRARTNADFAEYVAIATMGQRTQAIGAAGPGEAYYQFMTRQYAPAIAQRDLFSAITASPDIARSLDVRSHLLSPRDHLPFGLTADERAMAETPNRYLDFRIDNFRNYKPTDAYSGTAFDPYTGKVFMGRFNQFELAGAHTFKPDEDAIARATATERQRTEALRTELIAARQGYQQAQAEYVLPLLSQAGLIRPEFGAAITEQQAQAKTIIPLLSQAGILPAEVGSVIAAQPPGSLQQLAAMHANDQKLRQAFNQAANEQLKAEAVQRRPYMSFEAKPGYPGLTLDQAMQGESKGLYKMMNLPHEGNEQELISNFYDMSRPRSGFISGVGTLETPMVGYNLNPYPSFLKAQFGSESGPKPDLGTLNADIDKAQKDLASTRAALVPQLKAEVADQLGLGLTPEVPRGFEADLAPLIDAGQIAPELLGPRAAGQATVSLGDFRRKEAELMDLQKRLERTTLAQELNKPRDAFYDLKGIKPDNIAVMKIFNFETDPFSRTKAGDVSAIFIEHQRTKPLMASQFNPSWIQETVPQSSGMPNTGAGSTPTFKPDIGPDRAIKVDRRVYDINQIFQFDRRDFGNLGAAKIAQLDQFRSSLGLNPDLPFNQFSDVFVRRINTQQLDSSVIFSRYWGDLQMKFTGADPKAVKFLTDFKTSLERNPDLTVKQALTDLLTQPTRPDGTRGINELAVMQDQLRRMNVPVDMLMGDKLNPTEAQAWRREVIQNIDATLKTVAADRQMLRGPTEIFEVTAIQGRKGFEHLPKEAMSGYVLLDPATGQFKGASLFSHDNVQSAFAQRFGAVSGNFERSNVTVPQPFQTAVTDTASQMMRGLGEVGLRQPAELRLTANGTPRLEISNTSGTLLAQGRGNDVLFALPYKMLPYPELESWKAIGRDADFRSWQSAQYRLGTTSLEGKFGPNFMGLGSAPFEGEINIWSIPKGTHLFNEAFSEIEAHTPLAKTDQVRLQGVEAIPKRLLSTDDTVRLLNRWGTDPNLATDAFTPSSLVNQAVNDFRGQFINFSATGVRGNEQFEQLGRLSPSGRFLMEDMSAEGTRITWNFDKTGNLLPKSQPMTTFFDDSQFLSPIGKTLSQSGLRPMMSAETRLRVEELRDQIRHDLAGKMPEEQLRNLDNLQIEVIRGNIPNAFATMVDNQRHVFVTEGALTTAGGLEQLRGVMAHELGHHAIGHTDDFGRGMARNLALGIMQDRLNQIPRTPTEE